MLFIIIEIQEQQYCSYTFIKLEYGIAYITDLSRSWKMMFKKSNNSWRFRRCRWYLVCLSGVHNVISIFVDEYPCENFMLTTTVYHKGVLLWRPFTMTTVYNDDSQLISQKYSSKLHFFTRTLNWCYTWYNGFIPHYFFYSL